ncbi:tetratricopeptide repeat protein [Flavobacteriaceae bacterium]|nr:tetratricopeptide repeat protein [Flavobacteriaceae bacterium]
MKNFFLVFFCIVCIYLNYLRLESFILQPQLLYDFANDEVSYEFHQIKNKIKNYPSLAINTIPINSLLSKYAIDSKKFDDAIRLLEQGNKLNPYLAFSDYQLSRIYIQLNDYDKAFRYIEKAYKLSPNIISISALYKALSELINLEE